MALKLGSTGSALRVGSTTAKYARVGTTLKAVAPPLDIAGSAAAAYSLRKLSYAYTGPVVEVRRSSDDTTADFTADEVEDGTLAAWVGAGSDGFVATWYDQSGNDRDATQATAGYQPKIVDNGSVVTEGGKPALQFDGVDDGLLSPYSIDLESSKTMSVMSVLSYISGNTHFASLARSGTNDYQRGACISIFPTAGYTEIVLGNGASFYGQYRRPLPQPGQMIWSSIVSAPESSVESGFNGSVDETALADNTGGATVSTWLQSGSGQHAVAIGARLLITLSQFSEMKYQEMILYASDQTANRTAIEGNLCWHYGLENKLPYNHAEVKPQTLPADTDVLAFAAASGATSIPDLLKVEDLVAYLKAQSLWDYARFYPMKSAQNAGSGSTVYGLGGLTSNNMTLVNSPTWGSDGVTFDGSTQYGEMPSADDFDFEYTDSFAWFSKSFATSGATQAVFGKQDQLAGLARGYSFLLITGDRVDLQSENGNAIAKTTSSAFTQNQFVTRDFYYSGSATPSADDLAIYVDGAAPATTTSSDTLSGTISTTAKFRVAARGHGAIALPFTGKVQSICCVGTAITTTQREAITDLINAL